MEAFQNDINGKNSLIGTAQLLLSRTSVTNLQLH